MTQPSVDASDVLLRLAQVIESRKGADPAQSYVAKLFHKGTDAILKKVGEEATEAVMAAKDLDHRPDDAAARQALVGELADLWFHSMVAMAHLGCASVADITPAVLWTATAPHAATCPPARPTHLQ